MKGGGVDLVFGWGPEFGLWGGGELVQGEWVGGAVGGPPPPPQETLSC